MKTPLKNPKIKPHFDSKGNWKLGDNNILLPDELKPNLTPGAWRLLLLLESKATPALLTKMIGSRTTQWRKRKELKDKGYL